MVKQRIKSETYLDNKVDKNSRYIASKMIKDEKIRIGSRKFDIYIKPDIDTSNIKEWVKHRVTEIDYSRIDNISYKYYSRPDYWFAIALVNDIQNPLDDISIGDTLFIPPLEIVQKALGLE